MPRFALHYFWQHPADANEALKSLPIKSGFISRVCQTIAFQGLSRFESQPIRVPCQSRSTTASPQCSTRSTTLVLPHWIVRPYPSAPTIVSPATSSLRFHNAPTMPRNLQFVCQFVCPLFSCVSISFACQSVSCTGQVQSAQLCVSQSVSGCVLW